MLDAHSILSIIFVGMILAVGGVGGIALLAIVAMLVKALYDCWKFKHKRKGLRKI